MTLPVYHPDHKHNAQYVQCLQACIDGKPLTVQRLSSYNDTWCDAIICADGMPDLTVWVGEQIRIKPPEPTLITRTVCRPAGVTVEPNDGRACWIVWAGHAKPYPVTWFKRYGAIDSYRIAFQQGYLYTNHSDAQACWDALFGSQS